jgi:ribosomal protein S18 acetylase RimI-like enzyme
MVAVGDISTAQGRGLNISALSAADLDGAQALVAEAGWNQVRADWELFIELGAAVKVTAEDGAAAATAATLPFARFGWISMVLVGKRHRRQGIATALLEHCIARLREHGLVPVLDATPAGRTVYRPLGFHDGWQITRWRRVERIVIARLTRNPSGNADSLEAWIPDARHAATTVRALREDDWPELLALDEKAFGSARIALLRRLESRSRGFACVAERDGRVAGYLMGRNGRQAMQVGPIVAHDQNLAKVLLAHALARIDGPVLLDVLDCHTGIPPQLTAAGFAVERSYTRMTLHADAAFGDASLMVAIAGPELG